MLVPIILMTYPDLPDLFDTEKRKKDNAMKNTYWLVGTRLTVLADQTNTGGRYDLITKGSELVDAAVRHSTCK